MAAGGGTEVNKVVRSGPAGPDRSPGWEPARRGTVGGIGVTADRRTLLPPGALVEDGVMADPARRTLGSWAAIEFCAGVEACHDVTPVTAAASISEVVLAARDRRSDGKVRGNPARTGWPAEWSVPSVDHLGSAAVELVLLVPASAVCRFDEPDPPGLRPTFPGCLPRPE